MNNNLEEKILNSFNKDMEPSLRHKLIMLYKIYKNTDYKQKDPKKNLIQIEESYKNVLNKIDDLCVEDLKKTKKYDNKNNVNYYDNKLDDSILHRYIMLSDCINNYDENNINVKKKIIKLLTEIEILLNLPVTYTSQIENSIEDLINNEINSDKKGGVGLVRRNNYRNKKQNR